uniref:Uncharacterized protein n=1 Tax=Ananas comosus var. bracteatus TaxID=296719 RepID=A0A6V7NMI5_ANACO|nr:unnamed protein product [Ananas comosus var. bracteatus]
MLGSIVLRSPTPSPHYSAAAGGVDVSRRKCRAWFAGPRGGAVAPSPSSSPSVEAASIAGLGIPLSYKKPRTISQITARHSRAMNPITAGGPILHLKISKKNCLEKTLRNSGTKGKTFSDTRRATENKDELEEEEKARMPDSPFTRLLRSKGRHPAWYTLAPDHETY